MHGRKLRHDPASGDHVFANDPREGYFNGTRFLHPDMRFQITFPEAVVAVSGGKDAVVELALAGEARVESSLGRCC